MRTVWTKGPDGRSCIHCGLTWDMHVCDGKSSCPTRANGIRYEIDYTVEELAALLRAKDRHIERLEAERVARVIAEIEAKPSILDIMCDHPGCDKPMWSRHHWHAKSASDICPHCHQERCGCDDPASFAGTSAPKSPDPPQGSAQ